MAYMFAQSDFNKDISKWNVSKVTNMTAMFASAKFNQPIGNWDIHNVDVMDSMFAYSSFNQDISKWNLASIGNESNMADTFKKCPIKRAFKPRLQK